MRILNFGSLNFDYVYRVDHMVLPGETLDTLSRETHFGGKGFNQSVALARAGAPVCHAGLLGEDGDPFLALCKTYGVNTTYIQKVSGASGHTVIQLDKNAQNSILLYGGANRKITKAFVDKVLAGFSRGDFLLLQNEINELPYIIHAAGERGMRIFLNPSPYNGALDACDLSKISCFLINEVEAEQICGEKDPQRILQKMPVFFPHAAILLTLGAKGAVYKHKNLEIFQESFPVKAVDTTGAGDTFTGYFIAGMAEKLPPKENLRRAAKAAAMAVSQMGAAEAIPERHTVEAAL